KGGLEGLVIGEVLTCEAHPNSDHMHVTTVNLGQGEPVQIVCGAPNVAAGQKVVVATLGTKLYDGDECFTIKKSKLRGVESVGMICAEDEIGIGTDHAGIIVLPETAVPGTLAKDYDCSYLNLVAFSLFLRWLNLQSLSLLLLNSSMFLLSLNLSLNLSQSLSLLSSF
ncbi:phenylalanyl-tRNA synthetase beta subunit, partial [human gut metagenome]